MIRASLLPLAALAACEAAGDGRVAAGRDEPPRAPPAATRPTGVRPDPGAADCPLVVRFGSYAMGIDRPALAAVEALLAAEPAVRAVERSPWGREGEVALCVRMGGDAEPLARRIAALLPAEPRGPVSVATRTGLVFHAPPRR